MRTEEQWCSSVKLTQFRMEHRSLRLVAKRWKNARDVQTEYRYASLSVRLTLHFQTFFRARFTRIFTLHAKQIMLV